MRNLWYVILSLVVTLITLLFAGKFWHRHRRPRPVEYNANPDFHSGIKQKENDAGKTPALKKKSAAAALRMQSTGGASEPQTPSRSNGDVEGSRRSASPRGNDDDRGISPISTASSASEPPLAQRVKLNGASHAKSTPTPAPPVATPAKAQVVEPTTSSVAPPAPASAPPSPTKTRVCIAIATSFESSTDIPTSRRCGSQMRYRICRHDTPTTSLKSFCVKSTQAARPSGASSAWTALARYVN